MELHHADSIENPIRSIHNGLVSKVYMKEGQDGERTIVLIMSSRYETQGDCSPVSGTFRDISYALRLVQS
ncbi:hypothetical protein BDV28DRAFT_136595 [Aspergillus coremiiformis]|uniref:Uncharacterized protein n=1 Tax=Aspergillus coremiiformis TaxID=138285 RepID=A0A5N6Z209_9EURO|nr:hypothetical protein BDV28DRAFT_136595 [Aspergillus coremiiformis]